MSASSATPSIPRLSAGNDPKSDARPVPDPEQPDINSVRALRTQTVRRGNHVVANGPAVAVHVDGDDLSVVVCFDLVPDVALVDLVAQAGNLIRGRVGAVGLGGCVVAGISASLIFPLSKAYCYALHSTILRESGTTKERPHTGTQAPKRNKGRIH